MNSRADSSQRAVPTKPYDLIREGLTVFLLAALIIGLLALAFGSPDYPPVRSEDVAKLQPIAFLQTSLSFLAGESGIDGYGPPYTSDRSNAQNLDGTAPANWLGVTHPLRPAQDFVLQPLARAAALDPGLGQALHTYNSATPAQQGFWLKAYQTALESAVVQDGQVRLPPGSYGPVPVLMSGMLNLGRGGLLEGALQSDTSSPYALDFTRSLLFFQDSVDTGVAAKLDMTGDQWGISHETGPYPGSWWLWPYTFLYQVPALAASPNADLLIGAIMLLVFLVLLLMPFLPILNRVPRWLRLYRLIWRDWYQRLDTARYQR